MKEWTYWAFNAVALLALTVAGISPIVALAVVAICLTFAVISYGRDRSAIGNPWLAFLGSSLMWASVYAVLVFPNMSETTFHIVSVGLVCGFGIIVAWIFRLAWLKREAREMARSKSDES